MKALNCVCCGAPLSIENGNFPLNRYLMCGYCQSINVLENGRVIETARHPNEQFHITREFVNKSYSSYSTNVPVINAWGSR